MIAEDSSFIKQAKTHKQHIKQIIALLVLVALVYLSYHGVLTWILDSTINQHILDVGHSYLNVAQADALETLGVIGITKTGLAIIQSSSGGISFFIDIQVQLGELFNVFSEVINRAWQISWLSLASIETLKLLLNFSRYTLTPILTLSFIFLGSGYGLSLFSSLGSSFIMILTKGFYYLSRWGFFLLLMIHLAIPVSIFTISSINTLIFTEKKQAIHQEFLKIKKQIGDHKKESGLHSQVKSAIKAFKGNQNSVHERSKDLSSLVASHAVYSLFEHLIIPLTLIFLFSVFIHKFFIKMKFNFNLLRGNL